MTRSCFSLLLAFLFDGGGVFSPAARQGCRRYKQRPHTIKGRDLIIFFDSTAESKIKTRALLSAISSSAFYCVRGFRMEALYSRFIDLHTVVCIEAPESNSRSDGK